MDLDNELQPDALLRNEEACGGQSRISEDDYVEGAPELIMEIAASSASYDLHHKLRVYRRNGLQEYIVWQIAEQKVSWFSLQAGDYITLAPDDTGVIRSRIFPGLNLQVTALLTGDLAGVLVEVQRGTAIEAHQLFVEQLTLQRLRRHSD